MSDNRFTEETDVEQDRLEALYRYDILDTVAESQFDGLTRLASRICDAPVSLINLMDLNHLAQDSKKARENANDWMTKTASSRKVDEEIAVRPSSGSSSR